MPALFIIQAEVSPDRALREHYRQFQAAVQPLIEAHGGRFRASGVGLEVLEGVHDGRRLVVFEFPSMDALCTFWHSPEYAEVKRLRARGCGGDRRLGGTSSLTSMRTMIFTHAPQAGRGSSRAIARVRDFRRQRSSGRRAIRVQLSIKELV